MENLLPDNHCLSSCYQCRIHDLHGSDMWIEFDPLGA
jgi:hypothetical protein